MDDTKFRSLGWASHIIRMKNERISKTVLNRNFITQDWLNTKNKIGGRPERHITDPRDTIMEEKSRKVKEKNGGVF